MASFTIEYMKYCPEWLQVDEENLVPGFTNPIHHEIHANLGGGETVEVKEPGKNLGQNHKDSRLIEALMINSRGSINDKLCVKCQVGQGFTMECRSLIDYFGGTCENCKRKGRGQQCSLNSKYVDDGVVSKKVKDEKDKQDRDNADRQLQHHIMQSIEHCRNHAEHAPDSNFGTLCEACDDCGADRGLYVMVGLVAGILSRLRSRDIRRGSAKDTAQLPSILNVATEGVALALGHSAGSYGEGVTAR